MVSVTFYRICRLLVRFLLSVICRIETLNENRAAEGGPVLICCNHQSILDPLLIAAVMRRRLLFLAAGYLFDIPLLGWILRAVGVLPIQGTGRSLRSLRTALQHLKEGGSVVIFPQGGVQEPDEELTLQPGAFYIAARAGVPLQPMFIEGTGRVVPGGYYLPRSFRSEVMINFGNVIEPDSIHPKKERERDTSRRQQLSDRLLQSWRELRDEIAAYR